MKRSREVRPTADYLQRLRASHEELGIPADYARRTGLPCYPEPAILLETEPDVFGRPQRLVPQALAAWAGMQSAAANSGVNLQLISAFRSVSYQHDLIARKLARGQTIEQILAVNAAPGHSEHHTGRALDIGTSDAEPLQAEFAETPAFQWLSRHAQRFGFVLSFPPDNPFGIDYEPWHWCFQDDDDGV